MVTRSIFHSLQELRKRWKETKEISKERFPLTVNDIKEILELPDRDNNDLQNVRDFAVMMLSHGMDEARQKNDYEKYDFLNDILQAVTSVIDKMKFDRGLEP